MFWTGFLTEGERGFPFCCSCAACMLHTLLHVIEIYGRSAS
jgi:hypothetical protein